MGLPQKVVAEAEASAVGRRVWRYTPPSAVRVPEVSPFALFLIVLLPRV